MFIFQSYNEFGSYLCREVFTDMSVLPLVFPSNISCFSSGSYKVELSNLVSGSKVVLQEELSRTRELPVPPQPRRSGVLARSDDNLAGQTSWIYSTVSLLSNISLVILAGWYNCLFLQSNAREILRRPAAQSFSNTPPFKDVSIILLLNYERLSAWSEKLCQSTPTCDILHLTNFTSW